MRTFLVILAATALLATTAYADALKTEAETRALADNVMGAIGRGDMESAFKSIQPYLSITQTELDSLLLQTRTQREQFRERWGKTFGSEYIGTYKAGDSLIRHDYIEKAERTAFSWKLIFYRGAEGWVINAFRWGDVDKELVWK